MNTIEKSLLKQPEEYDQKPKEFDNNRQKHGDAAQRQGHPTGQSDYQRQLANDMGKRNRLHLAATLGETETVAPDEGLFDHDNSDYDPFSPALEAADEETVVEAPVKPVIEEISPSKEKERISDVVTFALERNDEYELDSLFRVLYSRNLILENELSPNDTTSELASLVDFIEDQNNLIAEALEEIRGTNTIEDTPVSKAETGAPDKRLAIGQMARRVTLDPEYANDDYGDDDFMSGMHYTDRP